MFGKPCVLARASDIVVASGVLDTAIAERAGATITLSDAGRVIDGTALRTDKAERFDGFLSARDDHQKYELSKLILQRVENFVIAPKHFETWSADKRSRILGAFEVSMFEPVPIEDHHDLMLF